jgi:hypothetical protein
MNWFKTAALSLKEKKSLEGLSGYSVFEEHNIDGYDIFIAKSPYSMMSLLPKYQIGLKREDLMLATPNDAFNKQEIKIPDIDPNVTLEKIKDLIQGWLSSYGDLLAASMNPAKNRTYISLLKHLGFNIVNINFHGSNLPVIKA